METRRLLFRKRSRVINSRPDGRDSFIAFSFNPLYYVTRICRNFIKRTWGRKGGGIRGGSPAPSIFAKLRTPRRSYVSPYPTFVANVLHLCLALARVVRSSLNRPLNPLSFSAVSPPRSRPAIVLKGPRRRGPLRRSNIFPLRNCFL